MAKRERMLWKLAGEEKVNRGYETVSALFIESYVKRGRGSRALRRSDGKLYALLLCLISL